MLERISEWFKRLPKCSRLDSPSDLSDIYNLIPLNSNNCFSPKHCNKMAKEKTELFLTWYAKNSFFECYHKKGSKLLDRPWKSVVISTHVMNDIFYLIFMDMCTLHHKIFDLTDKKSWKSSCQTMLEKQYRPSRIFTKYDYPFNSRDFESYAQSCGYVMCGWNSYKFLQKQIHYFKESYELMGKVKYIINNSSTVENDLTFLNMNIASKEELDGSESEEYIAEKTDEETEALGSKTSKFEIASFENTRTDGTTRNRKSEQIFDSKDGLNEKISRNDLKHKQFKNKNIFEKKSMTFNHKDSNKGIDFSSSIIGSRTHFFSENKRLKNAFLNSNIKNKILENKTSAHRKWECVLLEITVKVEMFYFIFMDADSCYPQVIESEGCDEASCIDVCKRFLERYPCTKELHVATGKPFESEDLKNYLEIRGIKYYFNSPLVQYLKQPRAAFTVIKRIISRNYSYEKRSQVLSEFVKKKVITRNVSGRRSRSMTNVSWKGNRVLSVKMTNEDGDYLLFVDLEKALVEAYPKKPNGRFIFPQEMIVSFVQAFNEFGIPKELHTIGGGLFDTPEFDRLVEYCYIRHCRDCWHAKEGTRYFNLLEKVKCCFARTSDIGSGLILWESFRERLQISRRSAHRRRRKVKKGHPQKSSTARRRNIYKHSKYSSDSYQLTFGRTSQKVNDKKYQEKMRELSIKKKITVKPNNLGTLSKRNKLKNLKSSIKSEIDGTKYQRILNKFLKRREKSFEKTSVPSMKQKTRSNEKLKKNLSKALSKYKKNHSNKFCGIN